MKILNLKRDNRETTVKLSRLEVGYILNALYYSMDMGTQKGEALATLHDEFMVIKDLLDYGHVDKFTAQTIAKRQPQSQSQFSTPKPLVP